MALSGKLILILLLSNEFHAVVIASQGFDVFRCFSQASGAHKRIKSVLTFTLIMSSQKFCIGFEPISFHEFTAIGKYGLYERKNSPG